MTYQDNLLPDRNVSDGHITTYVSNAYRYELGKIVFTGAQDFYTNKGVRVIRVPYYFFLGKYLGTKLKSVPKLYKIISSISPDVILYHGTGGLALFVVVKYCKKHPNIKFYMDSHEDCNNSARNWISKNIQHKIIHKIITKYAYSYIDKLFYLSEESKDFLVNLYKLSPDKLEFYPLGGIIKSMEEKQVCRDRIRKELELKQGELLFVHSGKMDALKRTSDILKAMKSIDSNNIRLVLIGSMAEDVKDELEKLISEDGRAQFLGWKSGDELIEYLCACDMYLQPGSQSATMQNAICCGTPVMLYPHKSHAPYLVGNGFYVKTIEDISEGLKKIIKNPDILKDMSMASYKIAHELLDYKKLAERLYK